MNRIMFFWCIDKRATQTSLGIPTWSARAFRGFSLFLCCVLFLQLMGTVSFGTTGASATMDLPDLAGGLSEPAMGSTGSAIGLTGSAIGLTGSAISLTASSIELYRQVGSLLARGVEVEESLWYRSQNPMKKEHQMLLCEYSWRNGVPYLDMLALIATESNFDESCVSARTYYGYFQIGKGHFADLAATTKTENKPLDGSVNIKWGTAMYGWILAGDRVKSLPAVDRRDAALSIYSRGPIGYDRKGLNQTFLARYARKRALVESWYGTNRQE